MKTLLKQGRVIDYASQTDQILDILIENEVIAQLGEKIEENADQVIDCKGLLVMPGLIDMHVHLRDPGLTHKETIETGVKAASSGGFTTIACMPNTKPIVDQKETITYIIRESNRVGLTHVVPIAAITKGEEGVELVDFKALFEEGAVAFSDDGKPVTNTKLMKEAMRRASELNTRAISHCEDVYVGDGAIREGAVSRKLNLPGVSDEAEEIMVARDIILSENNELPVHIAHISTKSSARMIRDAKGRGARVTCETCPHYFCFTEEEVLVSGSNAKMNPPLRTERDRQAIIEAICDGTVDVIVTDHAPHTEEEKAGEMATAPNGIIGLETAVSSVITNLIDTKKIDYLKMVELMSYNPAKLLGLERGTICKGGIADISIIDPDEEYIYLKEEIVSKSKNSPFIGKKLRGRVRYTIVSGKIVYKR